MKKSPKTQATQATTPKAANLTAPVKAQSGASTAVDGKLLELAARGGEKELSAAFHMFADMSMEQLRLARRAAWRLEEWADSYLIGNGDDI